MDKNLLKNAGNKVYFSCKDVEEPLPKVASLDIFQSFQHTKNL